MAAACCGLAERPLGAVPSPPVLLPHTRSKPSSKHRTSKLGRGLVADLPTSPVGLVAGRRTARHPKNADLA